MVFTFDGRLAESSTNGATAAAMLSAVTGSIAPLNSGELETSMGSVKGVFLMT